MIGWAVLSLSGIWLAERPQCFIIVLRNVYRTLCFAPQCKAHHVKLCPSPRAGGGQWETSDFPRRDTSVYSKHYRGGIKFKWKQERCRWDLKSLGSYKKNGLLFCFLEGVLNNDKEDLSFTSFGISLLCVPWKIPNKYVKLNGASWF